MLLEKLFGLRSKSPSWHSHFSFRNVVDIHGNVIGGRIMRRYVMGEWQYRPETSEELRDRIEAEAW